MSVTFNAYKQPVDAEHNLLTDHNGELWRYGYTYLLGSYGSTAPTARPTRPQTLYIPTSASTNYLTYGNCLYSMMGVVQRGLVYGDGSTLSVVVPKQPFHVCSSINIDTGGQPGTGPWPLFETVEAGSDTITLVNPADASMLTVRKWCFLQGVDLQGFGYPSNPQFSENKFITKIDTDTGVVTFSKPLVHSYKSTWPYWDHGDGSHPDLGGPGTIVMYGENHGCAYVCRDVGFDNTTSQSAFGTAGFERYENCRWKAGGTGWSPVPSSQEYSYYKDCQMLGDKIEVDKLIDYLEYDNCEIDRLQMQSPCNDHLIKNCTIRQIDGTGLDVTIENSVVEVFSGGQPQSYGVSNSLTLRDSTIGSTSFGWSERQFTLSNAIMQTITDSGGELTIPKATFTGGDARGNLAPGGCYIIGADTYAHIGPAFKVTDIRRSDPEDYESDIIVTTTLTGPVPSITNGDANRIYVHPCPRLLVENCTGSLEIETESSISGVHPAAQRAKWTAYEVAVSNIFQSATQTVSGIFVSLTVNVIRPYTGSVHANLTLQLGQFGVSLYPDLFPNLYNPYINLKVAGTRVITATVASGAQSGDVLTPPGVDQWWVSANDALPVYIVGTGGGGTHADFSADVQSTWPIIDFDLVLDHEFDPDA
jgi:hypothetical protein